MRPLLNGGTLQTNDAVYFACTDCSVLVDAGYRGAACELETPGVVARRARVSATAVLAASSYWAPPSDSESEWLTHQVLPAVRAFLAEHHEHRLTYGDVEEVVGLDPIAILRWLDVGYSAEITPRYLVDILGFRLWSEAVEWARSRDPRLWWWDDAELNDSARTKFQEIASRAAQQGVPDGLVGRETAPPGARS